MVAHKPEAIIITDGSSCRWHFTMPNLLARGYEVTNDRESYAGAFSDYFEEHYGYKVTAMAYHGTCFYIKIEPINIDFNPIRYKKIVAGEGHKGLKPVKE